VARDRDPDGDRGNDHQPGNNPACASVRDRPKCGRQVRERSARDLGADGQAVRVADELRHDTPDGADVGEGRHRVDAEREHDHGGANNGTGPSLPKEHAECEHGEELEHRREQEESMSDVLDQRSASPQQDEREDEQGEDQKIDVAAFDPEHDRR